MVLAIATVLSIISTSLLATVLGPSAVKSIASGITRMLKPTYHTLRVTASHDPMGFAGIMDFWHKHAQEVARLPHTQSVFFSSHNTNVLVPQAASGWQQVTTDGVYVKAVEDVNDQLVGWDVGVRKRKHKTSELAKDWLQTYRRLNQT